MSDSIPISSPPPIAPRAMTIDRFVSAYGVSRAKTYQLLKAGELRGVKVGRRTLIPAESAETWFASLPEA
ncbi:excisionase family DNA-binding protein [Hyphobacterium lacteum]|uniref:excisionase family DNA-binding protein n=1 Tax=Hyphobacterium lacteum TaxID=3116575 RepID=UPI0035A0B994